VAVIRKRIEAKIARIDTEKASNVHVARSVEKMQHASTNPAVNTDPNCQALRNVMMS
jgi:hypothetical protein